MDSTGKGRDWVRGGLVALAYFATSQLGLEFAHVGHSVTLFWPPSGIALAALLIFGWRIFPAIALGEFFANLGGGLPVTTILGFSCGNALEGLLGFYLLNQRGFDVHLKTLRDVRSLFVFGAIISPLVAAINGAWWITLATGASWNDYLHTVQYWWMGDALGIALFTTAILAWRYGEPMKWTRAYIQRALLGGALLLAVCVVLVTDLANWLPQFGLLLPLLIWISLNFNLRCVSGALLLIFLSSMLGLLSLGELQGTRGDSLLNYVWLYNLLFAITSLSVAALNAQRNRSEAALLDSKASLRAMLDNIPYLAWLKDKEGRFVSFNQAFFKTTGRADKQEILGKTDYDLWPHELAAKYHSVDVEVMRTQRQSLVEEILLDNGREHWIETYKAPIIGKNGELLGTTGFARDIGQRKQEESALRLAARVFESSGEAIVITDEKANVVAVNHAFVEMSGYRSEEMRGKNPRILK